MQAYRVSSLCIYPVKSLGGIELSEVRVLQTGFEYDRHWMLVHEDGRFISQREFPVMSLFSLRQRAEGFKVYYDGEECLIPFRQESSSTMQVQIWDDRVIAQEGSDFLNSWFSEKLSVSCKLVQLTEQTQRRVDPKYADKGEITGFGDAFPVLVLGEEALNFLNTKLEEKLLMNRFRPNLVFTGGLAHDEDLWNEVHVGDAVLKISKPCGRCAITTINQQTAVVGKEPLATLNTYRQEAHKILFGQNTLVLKEGKIKKGDQLHVSFKK